LKVKKRFERAIKRLKKRDRDLFRLGANERSFTHKLATYLQQEFPRWHVDCEYNRDGIRPKTLGLDEHEEVPIADAEGATVFPDIIIHRRNTKNNLAVVEAKKSTNRRGDQWDIRKLRAYKTQLRYRFAVFIVFVIQDEACDVKLKWIEIDNQNLA
jgi:hypothetical protein